MPYTPNHPYRPAIERVCAEVGTVTPNIFEAMVGTESDFNPNAVSASNAIGLTQVIPRWHLRLINDVVSQLRKDFPSASEALLDPEVSLYVGARHLKWCYAECGSWTGAVRKYHSGSCNPPANFADGQGTTSDGHIKRFTAYLKAVEAHRSQAPQGDSPVTITCGRVPIYGYEDRFIAEKREGFGWNNLGARKLKFITLHRMVGTLRGTDGYFRQSGISSYTDFGLSIKASDPSLTAGTIYLWNNPRGHRAPWASGPVSAPYGDGRAIVDANGINAVNRDGISLEIGGHNEVIDEASWKEIVWFCAYWADQLNIPYTSLPINPHTGIGFLIFHEEFTYGTGKRCPFQYVKDNVNKLYRDMKAFMKPYQEGDVAGPVVTPPPVAPPPAPVWSRPYPVKELALADPSGEDTTSFSTTVKGIEFNAIFDEVTPVRTTLQRQFANPGPATDSNRVIGPDLQPGQIMTAMYRFVHQDTRFLMLSNWARVLEDDFRRVKD